MKKERQSNYELMKIISIIFIIIYHIIYHGKLLNNTSGMINLILKLILCFTLVHVNSFVLVTGYFQYNKEASLKNIFRTLNSAWFYKATIATILIITGLITLDKIEYFKVLNPFEIGYWFIGCYLILYILSPFLNLLIKNMTQKIHRKLIIVLLLCFSLFPFLSTQTFGTNTGYTVIQFITLYFVGSYFAKYPIQNNVHFKNYSKNKTQLLLLLGFVLLTILNYMFYIFGSTLETSGMALSIYIGNQITFNSLKYNCLIVILQSICYFLWFGTLQIKSKIINFISSLTLGIYLIHDNQYIKKILYKFLKIDTGFTITSLKIFFKIVLVTIIIFVGCAIIEYIRLTVFKFIKNRKLYKKITNKFYNYIEHY